MLFPIEICENIIDSCRSPRPWWPQTALAKTGSYRTWISCALTCRAWLARSRYNIYYMVELRWAYQVEMLLRTFGESPALADWVVILVVRGEKLRDRRYSDSDRYIPFIQHPLPQYLRKCRLLLLDIDHHCYPAWFIRSIPRVYSGVIGLDLLNTSNIVSLSFKNPEYHLRWISSFPNLRRLATPSYKVKSLDVNIVGYRPPQLEDLLFYPVQILSPRDIDVLMLLARGGSIVNLVLSIQDLDMNIDDISIGHDTQGLSSATEPLPCWRPLPFCEYGAGEEDGYRTYSKRSKP
ncbi:hypothetical protein OH76DRAFT_84762 [Lentinus brumalis]|uniref:F-box domain-containing protein n=1 Tax=Lentinus brumalis TaxID=2498619 RepID=A0A371CR10_9APHY|nr:hypothetical protein OH76DRAFT_84762 [Polyporus brumalis]